MLLGQGQTPVNRQKVTGKQKQQLIFFLQKSKKLLEHYAYETQRQVVTDMRGWGKNYVAGNAVRYTFAEGK